MTPDPSQSLDRPQASSLDKEALEASFWSDDVPIQRKPEPGVIPTDIPTSAAHENEADDSEALEPQPSESRETTSRFNRGWVWAMFLLAGAAGMGWFVYTKIMAPTGRQGGPEFGPMTVTVTQPKTATVEDKADYIATLESRESVTVQPQAAGRINQIFVKSGDRVKAGTPLIRLDAQQQEAQVAGRKAEVDAARAEIVAAQANLESARRSLTALKSTLKSRQSDLTFKQQEYNRFKALEAKGASSLQVLQEKRSDLDQAQASVSEIQAQMSTQEAAIAQAQADVVRRRQERDAAIASANQDKVQLRYFTIKAPIDGTVGDIPAKIGDLVNESSTLLSLTQNQALEIKIEVPQEAVNRLQLGMPVQLLNAENTVLKTGTVSYIAPEVSPTTQSVQVKAQFSNDGGQLRTNQMIKARIIWANRPSVLVPTTAISRLAGKNFIFVAEPYESSSCRNQGNTPTQGNIPNSPAADQWVAVQKPVELGPIINNSQDITEGLSVGDRVITSGLLQLQNCTPIQPNP